jgi:hypothetical protein
MPRAEVREKIAEVAGILGITDILDAPSAACPAATASAWRWGGPSSAIPSAS